MTLALGITWTVSSLALLAVVLSARARRRALARELHELRGALTAGRLAVDLMPLLGVTDPAVCVVASDELERSTDSLANFEDLLHRPVVPGPRGSVRIMRAASRRRSLRNGIDVHAELTRLSIVWREAAHRSGREFTFEWSGPRSGVFVRGRRREFAEIVANLVSNAIRHGDGAITLRGRAEAGSLRIEVGDHGPGLGKPIATLARSRRLGPHGHGLANAVRAAHRLGGAITSAPASSGALVVCELPACRGGDLLSAGSRARTGVSA